MMRILLAGEGRNELGNSYQPDQYRDQPEPGVLEAILRKVCPDGWEVAGGVLWKDIKKFRPNEPGKAEIRNLRGVMLRAREKGCHALAFSRDRDGKKNKKREQDIHLGIQELRDTYPDGPKIVGGMAIEKLESWLIAMMGENGSEQHRRPEDLLAESKVRTTKDMVKLVESAEFEKLPRDAKSLIDWIAEANKILAEPSD